MDKETQALKVQLLETQRSLLEQVIENAQMKLEKLEQTIIQERILLMGVEREVISNESHIDPFAHTTS